MPPLPFTTLLLEDPVQTLKHVLHSIGTACQQTFLLLFHVRQAVHQCLKMKDPIFERLRFVTGFIVFHFADLRFVAYQGLNLMKSLECL